METPNVTLVQKLVGAALTVASSLITLLVAFGVDITTEQIAAILGSLSAFGSFLVLADAIIRNGRSRALGSAAAIRELQQPGPPTVGR